MGLTLGQMAPTGTFNYPRVVGSGTTPFVQLIAPYGGAAGSPLQLCKPGLVPSSPSIQLCKFIAHVTKVTYTTGATAHNIQILRPMNYTWVTAAVAKNATTMTLFDDPGIFSTKYKYGLAGGVASSQVADNSIGSATTPFVVVQLADGTWFPTAVASYSAPTLTVSTAIPNIATSAGMVQFAPVYYFIPGVTQLDPANGMIQPTTQIALSQTKDSSWNDGGLGLGIAEALHPGDPLMFYSPATTNAGTLEYLTGYHAGN